MNRTFCWGCAALLGLSVLAAGCGKGKTGERPKTFPVSGTVTMKGQPVPDAQVVFQAQGKTPSATGFTEANGKYTLMTFEANDGALPGQYAVAIFKYDQPAAAASGGSGSAETSMGGMPTDYVPPGMAAPAQAAGPKNLLPAKYADAQSSGLTATVKEGTNELNFTLE